MDENLNICGKRQRMRTKVLLCVCQKCIIAASHISWGIQ